MEDKNKKFLTWALTEFNNDINIFEQKWPLFSHNYFDYRVVLKINNMLFEGRGTNVIKSEAIASALGEALERFAVNNTDKFSSNGFAIHSDINIAIANSQREVIERHYVMLFTLGYYNKIEIPITQVPERVIEIVQKLISIQIEISFFQLASTSDEVVVLCEINGLNYQKPFGLLFGASCKETLGKSIEASLKEPLPNLMAFLNGNLSSIEEAEFKMINKPKPEDHLHLYLNIDFTKKYLQQRKFVNHNSVIDRKLFISSIISYPFSDSYPVVFSTHPDCLQAKWGILHDEKLTNYNPSFPFILP